jgi:hypothetical protein
MVRNMSPKQHIHRAVPQQVHVLDAVRAADHPGDQAGNLQLGVDPARGARPDLICDQPGQAGSLGPRHDRDQPGPRHQIRGIKGCVRPGRPSDPGRSPYSKPPLEVMTIDQSFESFNEEDDKLLSFFPKICEMRLPLSRYL